MPIAAELKTDRLLLRPFRTSDVVDAQAYRNDIEFVRFLPHIAYPFTQEHAQAFVATNLAESWATSPTFAIELEGRVIGNLNFEVQTETASAMLGYAIGTPWWGQGFATEACRAAIEWAARSYQLCHIWASTDTRNVRSQRVLQKLGMQQDRVCLQHHTDRGGRTADEVFFSLQKLG